MPKIKNSFVATTDMAERRLDYVIALFTGLSRQKARQIVEQGIVLVNNIRVTFPSRKIRRGDHIMIIDSKPGMDKQPEVDIIWEDENVMIVNKPPGLLTEKIGSEKGLAVSEIFAKKGKTVYAVHRLDRETSGIMVFAKTTDACNFLRSQFKESRVNKTYIGIVAGILKSKKGLLKGVIKKSGEYAETYYQRVKFLKNATVLKLMPKTGRTHQLRLQLAQIGHPVIGDKQYYDIKKTTVVFRRQALHAWKISFIHPQTKRWVSFAAPIPEDIKELIKSLEY
ncbi:MAG: RluA family pseudouridine synthase [bacterium]